MIQKLLDIRKNLKSRKPSFRRHDSHKKIRVSSSWRSPKGRQSKQRLNRRGYARGIATGFGAPKAVYGLSKEGLTQNIVSSVKDLSSLDSKKDGIIISRTLGNRKKADVIKAATDGKFTVLNIDVEKFTKALDAALKEKSSRKKVIDKKREEKLKANAKASKKEEKDSKKETESVSAEEEKAKVKKEHDKILTKKGDQQ